MLKQKKDSLLYKFFTAQLSNPTHRDWVSQVLKELEEINIQLEIHDIEILSKDKFKILVKDAVYKKAFLDLLKKKRSRQSENAKGKQIIYSEFQLQEYLSSDNEDLTIEEKKLMFKCRVEDIDIGGNHHWKYSDITCLSCKKNIIETQRHLLFCEYLMGRNESIIYIPAYNELYNGELKEQIYVARLLQENFKRRIQDN